jgi:hypothetical protein
LLRLLRLLRLLQQFLLIALEANAVVITTGHNLLNCFFLGQQS